MKRKRMASGLRIFRVGMGGHFRSAPFLFNMDVKLLDCRQYRRLLRAEKKAS